MPALSMFFGIIIYMYREVGSKHKLPHIHAEYQDEEVVVTFDGEIIEGSMSNKKN